MIIDGKKISEKLIGEIKTEIIHLKKGKNFRSCCNSSR